MYTGTLNNVQLVIDTEELVTITRSTLTNTGAGDMIRGLGGGYGTHNLILDHCTITGGTGHILDTEHYDHIEVRNCTIDKTAGFKLTLGNAGCTVKFLRNKVSNMQKGVSSTYGGSVVQLNHCTNPSVAEIGWNEVISIHGQHWMEDIFSIINAARVHIHDNYLDGNSRPDNQPGTNGTITLEPSSNNCLVENNQMVDVATGIYFPVDCPNNMARGNRLIQDGYIGDTGIQMGSGQGGMNLHPPPNGSRMTGNTVGYVDMNGDRTDWSHMGGAPNGDAAAEIAKNTTLPDPITRQMEKDERTRWQSEADGGGHQSWGVGADCRDPDCCIRRRRIHRRRERQLSAANLDGVRQSRYAVLRPAVSPRWPAVRGHRRRDGIPHGLDSSWCHYHRRNLAAVRHREGKQRWPLARCRLACRRRRL